MSSCSLLLKDDVAIDPRAYGDLLAPLLGVTVHDARMAIRRGGGIVAEHLPEEEARRVAATLEADGIGCWCVPSSVLPELPAPRRVTGLEATPDGLRATLLNSTEPVELSWDRIGVVSIGLVTVPELQEEIAGVRKKDVAAVARREQEQRDLVRDRLLAVLNRVDLAHMENAPAASAHHYYFDRLRRKESKQLKAFADLVSDDGAEWWRLPLEESSFATEGAPAAANYQAVPVIYARRKDAHTERSRKLFQGGNVERLAFQTMEEFQRYTKWWTWRERFQAQPDLAAEANVAPSGGNGQAARVAAERRDEAPEIPRPAKSKLRPALLVLALVLVGAVAVGLKVERRGAECLLCKRNRQDDVVRLWGWALKETPGEWKLKPNQPPSAYDRLVGKPHDHLYDGFGYIRTGLVNLGDPYGRTPGGNAGPAELDAAEVANALLFWHESGQATDEDVREFYPKLFDRVRSEPDRNRWLELARLQPDRDAPDNLLKEISK